MAFSVNLTARAERDIEAVLEDILAQAPAAAAPWYARLTATIASLGHMPSRCSLADEADELGIELRELQFGKRRGAFRILFTITGDVVNVLHIRRATRGPVTADDL